MPRPEESREQAALRARMRELEARNQELEERVRDLERDVLDIWRACAAIGRGLQLFNDHAQREPEFLRVVNFLRRVGNPRDDPARRDDATD